MNHHRLGIVLHPRREIRECHKFQYRTCAADTPVRVLVRVCRPHQLTLQTVHPHCNRNPNSTTLVILSEAKPRAKRLAWRSRRTPTSHGITRALEVERPQHSNDDPKTNLGAPLLRV